MGDEQKDQQNPNAQLIPSPGDEQVGYRIWRLLDEVIREKSNQGLPQKWIRNYELGRNRHWRQKSKKATLITANLLETHRRRTVNLLTDNNPTFNVAKTGNLPEEQMGLRDVMLHMTEYWWTEFEQQSVLESSVWNGETYGCTIEKVSYFPGEIGIDDTGEPIPLTPGAETGGEVETTVVDPFHFGWWPVECKEIQKAVAVFHYYPMQVWEARRRWPKRAEAIRSDAKLLEELGDSRREIQAGKRTDSAGFFGTVSGVVKSFLNEAADGKGFKDQLLIVEAWVKDYTLVPIQDDQGFTVGVGPKYPGCIRCITCCNGGEVILSDRPNPSINPNLPLELAKQTYLFDKFPFSLTVSNTDTSNPWGVSDYEQLESLQLEVDKGLSQIATLKDRVARLKIINPRDSGVPDSAFTNAPGIIRPSSHMVAQGIRYMDPPMIPQDLTNAIALFKDFFFLVAGTFDLEAAQVPGRDVIAYKAIAALLERATMMTKGKIRSYCKMIRERGRMFMSHGQNWYTEKRWVSYQVEGEEMGVAVAGPELIIPARLTVVSGSTMPVSKVQQREEAIGLTDKGHLDTEELLKTLEWPDWRNVVRRLKEGPLGSFMQKLTEVGVPQEFIQYFQQIAQAKDDREVMRLLKEGILMDWPTALQAISSGQPTGPSPMDQAGLQEAQANAQKAQSEAQLILEQINTEKAKQTQIMAGVGFDQEKLKIERAQTVHDMDIGRRAQDQSEQTTLSEKKSQGVTGVKSDNKQSKE